MSTELDKAYMAGLFDGEGCISLSRGVSSYNKKGYHQLMITVGMANRDAVELFYKEFGGTFVVARKDHINPKWNTIYRWQLSSGKDCARFIEVLGPYLRAKAPLLDLASKFIATIGRGRTSITEDTLKLRDELYEKIHAINQKD